MGNIVHRPAGDALNKESFQECCNELKQLRLKTRVYKEKTTKAKAVFRTVASGKQILRLSTQKPPRILTNLNSLFVFLVENCELLAQISGSNDSKLSGKSKTCLTELHTILDRITVKLDTKEDKTLLFVSKSEKHVVYINFYTASATSGKNKTDVIEIPESYIHQYEPPGNAIMQSLCKFVKYSNVLDALTASISGSEQRYVDMDTESTASSQREDSKSRQSESSSPLASTSGSVPAPQRPPRGKDKGKINRTMTSPKNTPIKNKQEEPKSMTRSSSSQRMHRNNDKTNSAENKTKTIENDQHRFTVQEIGFDAKASSSGMAQLENEIKLLRETNQKCECTIDSMKEEIDTSKARMGELEFDLDHRMAKHKTYKEALERSETKINNLQNKIKELESLADVLKNKYDIAVEQNELHCNDKSAQIHALQQEKQELKTTNTQLTEDLQKTQATLQQQSDSHKERITDLKEALNVAKSETSEMTTRLASEMNHKISSSETALENISIKCRPMNVADEYNVLVSNSWLDAKQILDKNHIPNKKSVTFLCDVLMIGHESATELYSNTKEAFNRTFNLSIADPFLTGNVSVQGKASLAKDVSSEVLNVYGDQLRRQADEIDIKPLHKIIKDKAGTQYPYLRKYLKYIEKYIEESSRLSWKMAIQRPPMKFDCPDVGEPFKGEKIHPLGWGSNPTKDATIRFYQYPSLLHDKTLMVKGKVFVA